MPRTPRRGWRWDFQGDYATARKYLARAVQAAPSEAGKLRALRDLAVSYGFQGDCRGASPFAQQAYDLALKTKDFYLAGEVADEAGRLCIDAGDLDGAEKWYRTGYDTGLREPGIKPDRRNLWQFRWEHAQARLAARRGDMAAAQKHVDAARAALAKGDNPQQERFLPYLLGYVAFYGGDYKTALAQFLKADVNDAFIQAMTAQTYEKLGDKEAALDLYRRIARNIAHNPPGAYAAPLARRKLGVKP